MHEIEPARLKPGSTLDRIPAAGPPDPDRGPQPDLIRGKALIFWDPTSLPGTRLARKLDAIDTDQITPAADCVSESLETLDERWKAGAFRYLMPDFRSRVHRGETFVIAGDRFAIGSSREMSPAGLKAVADEAGLELVVVCGGNMGDIFRRNAFNLGLHVVQSPEAVADARDGDEFSFDPISRRLRNETQAKTYDPLPLSAKEEEIRRSGGIFAVGRREFRTSVETAPVIDWADQASARRMTTTEQIVWAHRVDKAMRPDELKPGTTLRVYADLLPASDGTAPFAIHTFNQITGGRTIFPRQAAIANDHFVFTGLEADEKQTSIGRQFAELHGIQKPYYATPGDGIFHFYFPEQGLVYPGQLIPGADSHSRAYGAYGAVGVGVGSTTLGFGWATGYMYFTLARARRVVFAGRLRPWVSGKDIVLELLRRWGAKQSQGMSVELVDANRQLPIAYRNTIANMMAEAEAQNGIFAPDEITYTWYVGKAGPYPPIAPGADARYEIDETLDLSGIEPMIAKPFSPGNAYPAEEVARERIPFDKALIGSCTNGSYDDLLQAALVLRAARARGAKRVSRQLTIFPGSGGVRRQIEAPDPRLGGESIAEVFRSVGGEIRQSWCGPCFGQGPDALTPGQRAITSFNRNWQNRMGVGGEGYLASPAVVAASALLGYMGPPSELGLEWQPDLYT
jgi:3-isopropylmalate/(R)-2-methylmalate dehydratase large subunit